MIVNKTLFFSIFFIFALSLNAIEINGTDSNLTKKIENNATNQEKEKIVKIIQEDSKKDNINIETEDVDLIASRIVNSKNVSNATLEKSLKMNGIIEEIRNKNYQIALIKSQIIDFNGSNGSKNVSADINALIKEKNNLLGTVPAAIAHHVVDKNRFLQVIKRKKELNNIISSYGSDSKTPKYIDANIELKRIYLQEYFSLKLFQLEEIFEDGAQKGALTSILQKALIELQTNERYSIDDVKSRIDSKDLYKFDDKILKFSADRTTYEEIVNYLLSNVDSLSSNIFFRTLNLGSGINFINNIVPYHIKNFNFGKSIIIVLIIIIFYSLRRSLAKIIYFLFRAFSKNNKEDAVIKTQVVDIIKKPIGVILLIYAIDICSNIFYYPTPVPINFVNILSILYIIFYGWFIMVVLDGYAIVIIGQIAKKSGRKEVINLLVKILYVIVVIVVILLILRRLGFNISALLASLGLGGLAIALATKDIIANFFASVMMLFDNSFSQGDLVVIGTVEGNIVEMGLRKTTIRTSDNALVYVPNSKIMDSNIVNWNRRKIGRKMVINVGLTYGPSIDQLKNFIADIKLMLAQHQEIAQTDNNALSDLNSRLKFMQNVISIDDLVGYKNTTIVALNEFADSSINIHIECFTKTINRSKFFIVQENVLLNVMKLAEKHDVSFAFPSTSLYVEKLPDIMYDNKENKLKENGI